MDLKPFLLVFLVLVFVFYWVLPRTRLRGYLKISEALFRAISIVGVVCGSLGVLVSLRWPDLVLSNHYFELILLPVLVLYVYSGVVVTAKQGGEGAYDEKQIHDMTRAAANALQYSFCAVFLLYAAFREGILEGLVWFPIYVFLTLAVYSGSTLYYFRRL